MPWFRVSARQLLTNTHTDDELETAEDHAFEEDSSVPDELPGEHLQ